jgi:hypothetical protein
MATKTTKISAPQRRVKSKVRRPNVVSKNNTSSIKTSRNYKKKYKGQGR